MGLRDPPAVFPQRVVRPLIREPSPGFTIHLVFMSVADFYLSASAVRAVVPASPGHGPYVGSLDA